MSQGQYVATRPFPTAHRQYEIGDMIDMSRISSSELNAGVTSGAIEPAKFIDTAARLAALNPVLGPGVHAYETDTGVHKIGVDGVTHYADLDQVGNGTYAVKPARDTAAALATQVLAVGQKGIETDTGFERTGDGSTAFSALPVVAGPEDLRWVPAVSLSATTGAPSFVGAGSGSGQRFPAWLLDAATPEQVTATFSIPRHWGRFNLDLYWCNASSGSGDVQWRPTYSVRTDGQDLAAGDVVASDTIVTAGAQSILKVTRLLSGVVRADGLYHVRILRRADQAADTLANDVSLVGILLGKA